MTEPRKYDIPSKKNSKNDVKFGNIDIVLELMMDNTIKDKKVLSLLKEGFVLTDKGKHADSIKYYMEALSILPNNNAILNNTGLALSQIKKYVEAIKHYEKALLLVPAQVATLANIGLCYSKLGEYDLAISYYDGALLINPNHTTCIYNKACSFSMKGEFGMALDLLEQAIRLNQDCKKMAMTDEDFINMRESEPFRLLVA